MEKAAQGVIQGRKYEAKVWIRMEELAWSELRALQRNNFLMYLDRELYGLVITKS
jgi:hypothetical protein